MADATKKNKIFIAVNCVYLDWTNYVTYSNADGVSPTSKHLFFTNRGQKRRQSENMYTPF